SPASRAPHYVPCLFPPSTPPPLAPSPVPYTTLFRSFCPAERRRRTEHAVSGQAGFPAERRGARMVCARRSTRAQTIRAPRRSARSEEHTSELQSPDHLVCRLLLEKTKTRKSPHCMST